MELLGVNTFLSSSLFKSCVQYYSAIKKNEFVFPFETICMNQEGIMLNKMSDRERQILYAFIYRWNLKIKADKQI